MLSGADVADGHGSAVEGSAARARRPASTLSSVPRGPRRPVVSEPPLPITSFSPGHCGPLESGEQTFFSFVSAAPSLMFGM